MTFPAGFPAGFTSYERIPAEGGGTAERYANEAASRAARAGQPLPDGSAIVVVNRDAAGATTSYAAMAALPGRGETSRPCSATAIGTMPCSTPPASATSG